VRSPGGIRGYPLLKDCHFSGQIRVLASEVGEAFLGRSGEPGTDHSLTVAGTHEHGAIGVNSTEGV
jgi:hypothetical protein